MLLFLPIVCRGSLADFAVNGCGMGSLSTGILRGSFGFLTLVGDSIGTPSILLALSCRRGLSLAGL